MLRAGRVQLYPGRRVIVDVERFLRDAELAMRGPDDAACARVAGGCGGELLPRAPYEAWNSRVGEKSTYSLPVLDHITGAPAAAER